MTYDQISQMLTVAALAGPPALTFILKLLGTLVVLAQALVPILPGKASDEWNALQTKPVIGPILGTLMKFAVISKK